MTRELDSIHLRLIILSVWNVHYQKLLQWYMHTWLNTVNAWNLFSNSLWRSDVGIDAWILTGLFCCCCCCCSCFWQTNSTVLIVYSWSYIHWSLLGILCIGAGVQTRVNHMQGMCLTSCTIFPIPNLLDLRTDRTMPHRPLFVKPHPFQPRVTCLFYALLGFILFLDKFQINPKNCLQECGWQN